MNAKPILNRLLMVCCIALPLVMAGSVAASEDTEVRGTVKRVFEQLKSKDYSALYDSLPSSSRNRLSKERFTSALERAQGFYVLDRMDVGAVRVANNIAVVDTVLFGRIVKPFDTEGKIVVQQYLVREDGRWRVATGDNSTTQRFLANNPAFARKFPIKQPRIYVKQNGKWVEFTPPRRSR
jgi:hypothetical protein